MKDSHDPDGGKWCQSRTHVNGPLRCARDPHAEARMTWGSKGKKKKDSHDPTVENGVSLGPTSPRDSHLGAEVSFFSATLVQTRHAKLNICILYPTLGHTHVQASLQDIKVWGHPLTTSTLIQILQTISVLPPPLFHPTTPSVLPRPTGHLLNMSQPFVDNGAGVPAQHESLDESPECDKEIRRYEHFHHDEAYPSRTSSHVAFLNIVPHLLRYSRHSCRHVKCTISHPPLHVTISHF
jgi:hypothetical protein